jgi:hypothetical protein
VLCLHGELERGLLLRTELSGEDWVQGCEMFMRYSVQYKNLRYDIIFFPILKYDFILPFVYVHCIFHSSTIEMFKQLKDHFESDAFKRENLFGGSSMYSLCVEVSFCFLMT